MPKRQVIAFDLDDTLAVTRSPISDRMSVLLGKLLEKYDVCVISGGDFGQFKLQILDNLRVSPESLARLHLMPTTGTRYYRFDVDSEEWSLQYAEDLSEEQKIAIKNALEVSAKELGLWPEKPVGEVIEDRGSQVTLSALGQKATPEAKYEWAKTYAEQRPILRDKVAKLLPDLEVRIAGTTSTDVTMAGVDKGHGMERLMQRLEISKQDILFIGDKLEEGGNDYPVKAMGIDTVAVDGWEETALVIEGILAVS